MITDNHAGISSWTDNLVRQGIEPHTAWSKFAVRVPPLDIRRLMGMRSKERTVVIERLRSVDGSPICLMTNEIPQRLAPDLEQRGLDRESLYACLADRYGLHPSLAEEEVTARAATRAERSALETKSEIVLEVRRLTRMADGVAMELATVIGPVDRYQYRVTLNADSRWNSKARN